MSALMKMRNWSRSYFNKVFKEDIYGYIEKRFFPIVFKYMGSINGTVLDAACGFGNPYLEKLNINNSFTIGIDIDPAVKKKNRLHQKFIIEDLHNFNSELRFDFIVCVNTWEHLHSPILVLKNFFNVLSDDGVLIIIAP